MNAVHERQSVPMDGPVSTSSLEENERGAHLGAWSQDIADTLNSGHR
jgi:hypothetical protein